MFFDNVVSHDQDGIPNSKAGTFLASPRGQTVVQGLLQGGQKVLFSTTSH
jgi:hypothetical protein